MIKQFIIVFTLLTVDLAAQLETINWFTGSSTILNFTATPAIISSTFPITAGGAPGSSVSDVSGNLKIVTRGGFVYNAQGQLVAPQNPTVSAGTGEQSGLVIPMPGSPDIYYI